MKRISVSELCNYVFYFYLYLRKEIVREVKKTEGVLIVRFAHIGDFIVWLDAAKEFRKIYKGKKITLLCYRYKDIKVIAEKTGYFDEVIVVDTYGIARIHSLLQMSKKRYETVINANPSRSILSDLFVMAVKSKQRIAPKTDGTCMKRWFIPFSDSVYDSVIECDGIKTMELVRNGQFIEGISGEKYISTIPVLPTMTNNVSMPGRYFVICPGGETPLKYWEEEKYAAVLDYVLQKDTEIQCLILGTEKEKEIASRIKCISNIENTKRVTNDAGKTDLLQYIELIRNAEFVITNDTSAAHIAAATDTQAYVIAVSWDKGRFHPYVDEKEDCSRMIPIAIHAELKCAGCGLVGINMENPSCLVNGRMKCVSSVSVEQVIERIQENYIRERSFEKGREDV